LTETINVGLTGWTWTFWVRVWFSSRSTWVTVVSSTGTGSTLWGTLLTVEGTFDGEPSFFTFTSWSVSVGRIVTFETFVFVTRNTFFGTHFTFRFWGWFEVTGDTGTSWGVDSVWTTGYTVGGGDFTSITIIVTLDDFSRTDWDFINNS